MEKVVGEQGLGLHNIFHANPFNFPKIQTAKQYSVVPGAQTWPFWYFQYALSISGIL